MNESDGFQKLMKCRKRCRVGAYRKKENGILGVTGALNLPRIPLSERLYGMPVQNVRLHGIASFSIMPPTAGFQ